MSGHEARACNIWGNNGLFTSSRADLAATSVESGVGGDRCSCCDRAETFKITPKWTELIG